MDSFSYFILLLISFFDKNKIHFFYYFHCSLTCMLMYLVNSVCRYAIELFPLKKERTSEKERRMDDKKE